ncbi:MAG: SH3 domain-containing protein [Leptospiraceae bacterium]|nr:SH3 domain-containing protein [Leptospiraceae bacterium]
MFTVKYIFLVVLIFSNFFCNDNKTNEGKDSSLIPKKNDQYNKELNSTKSFAIVKSNGGLRLREDTNLNSKVITIIPNGQLVEFLELTSVKITIGSLTDNFVKIRYNSFIGYVFGGFIIYKHQENVRLFKEIMITENSKYSLKIIGRNLYQQNNTLHQASCEFFNIVECYTYVFDKNNKMLFSNITDRTLNFIKWIDEDNILFRGGLGDEGTVFRKEIIYQLPSLEKKYYLDYYINFPVMSKDIKKNYLDVKKCIKNSCLRFYMINFKLKIFKFNNDLKDEFVLSEYTYIPVEDKDIKDYSYYFFELIEDYNNIKFRVNNNHLNYNLQKEIIEKN